MNQKMVKWKKETTAVVKRFHEYSASGTQWILRTGERAPLCAQPRMEWTSRQSSRRTTQRHEEGHSSREQAFFMAPAFSLRDFGCHNFVRLYKHHNAQAALTSTDLAMAARRGV